MKKLNYFKLVLDTIMVVVFVLLFNKMVLGGLMFHEVAGLVVGAVALFHCSLNFKWIKGVTLKIFKGKMPIKTRIGYFIDILLLINFIVIIVCGVFISKILFPGLGSGGSQIFKVLHISIAYFSLALIGIHLGLHWSFVMNTFNKMFKITEKKRVYSFISKILVVLVLAFGIYSTYSVGFISKISMISSITSSSGGGNEMHNGGARPTEGNHGAPTAGGEQQGKPAGLPQVNVLGVITSYLGVVSVFAILEFYIEKILIKVKKN